MNTAQKTGLALLLLAAMPAAQAQNLTITNGSFERPATGATPGGYPGYTQNMIDGWNGINATILSTTDFGTQSYPLTETDVPGFLAADYTTQTVPANSGAQYAYINSGDIYQDVTGIVTPGQTYTLSAYLGDPGGDNTPGQIELQTLGGGPALASTGPITTPPVNGSGAFQQFSVSYTATAADALAGGFRVQLDDLAGIQVNYDLVTLSAAPEPSQFAGLGLGMLGLAGLALKARRRSA